MSYEDEYVWDVLGPFFRRESIGDGWEIVYDTTAASPVDAKRAPTYSDGFDDGWNANDVSRGTK